MKYKNNSTEIEIKKIFSDIMRVEIDEVNNNLKRDNCKNWDSLNHVRLILEIEKKLGIKIDNNDAIDLDSFESLIIFLKK